MTYVRGDWLKSVSTQTVFEVFEKAGHRIYAVGGCVRNDLLSVPVADVDMSTDAEPDVSTKLLEDAGLKVVPTGIDHGTITAVVEGVPYEVTTFRKDVETDGRRAVVAYATSIHDDAMRRDFTVNALYADRQGKILDPVSGLNDIATRTIRFIGNAQDRIREDYLRTLRFFRFHAFYSGEDFNQDALAAIAETLDGLESLSRERVGSEFLKLLSAPNPTPAIMVMAQVGVLSRLLPGVEPKALGPLVELARLAGLDTDPLLRLASFADLDTAKTLRLSRTQLKTVSELREWAMGAATPAMLGYRLRDRALSALVLRHAFLEQPLPPTEIMSLSDGARAHFPIVARDLMRRFQGPELGRELRRLEAEWMASNFKLTKSQLLG